jgi:hypothetical protein
MAANGTRTPGLHTPRPATPRSAADAGRKVPVKKPKKERRVGNETLPDSTWEERKERLVNDRWNDGLARVENARSLMLATFNFGWRQYVRIFNKERSVVRDVYHGRIKLNGQDPKVEPSEFIRTAKTFKTNMSNNNFERVSDCVQCCTALTSFVKFLACEKPYTGFDDRFRGIFNTRHLDFKNGWVNALRGIVRYTEGLYSNDKTAWDDFLKTRNINWTDIQHKLDAAETQVRIENIAATAKKKAPWRRIFGTSTRRSELAEPHALERMRGLLGEI